MPRPNLTDITVVLDRSGSMGALVDDTVHGFDHFVRVQQQAPGGAVLTLVEFSTECQIVHRATPIHEVPPLVFNPGGNTALLDAVGLTILDTAKRLAALDEAERPLQVLFVIITDGEENSSRLFTRQAVFDLISEKQTADGWQFAFLGANQDAFKEARNLGIPGGSVLGFDASGSGVSRAFDALSGSVSDFRLARASGDTVFFFPNDSDTVASVSPPQPNPWNERRERRRRAYLSALDFATGQIAALVQRSPDYFPAYTRGGRWHHDGERWTDWTGGFLTGLMWKFHALTNEPVWRKRAEHYSRLLEPRKDDRSVHDLGFLFLNSYLPWFEVTGAAAQKDVLIAAGKTLAERFQTPGRYLASFVGPESLFIDVMMNVPLIFYAANESKSERLREVAYAHANTTRKRLVRADGSTSQEAVFDPQTGEFVRHGAQQGLRPDSCWSRGLAWSLYGFCKVYAMTGWEEALQTSELNAGYWLTHLPTDRVPYWDFDVDLAAPLPLGPQKDSSAGAVAASGLLDLARQTKSTKRSETYRVAAMEILDVLTAPDYLARGVHGWEGILRHGVYHTAKNLGVDESTMWGEYYFVEALMKAMTYL